MKIFSKRRKIYAYWRKTRVNDRWSRASVYSPQKFPTCGIGLPFARVRTWTRTSQRKFGLRRGLTSKIEMKRTLFNFTILPSKFIGLFRFLCFDSWSIEICRLRVTPLRFEDLQIYAIIIIIMIINVSRVWKISIQTAKLSACWAVRESYKSTRNREKGNQTNLASFQCGIWMRIIRVSRLYLATLALAHVITIFFGS